MIPYNKRILIEPKETESLLVSADSKFQQVGEVKAIGWKPWYMFWKPRFVRVGDMVVFNSWGLDMVKLGDKEYFFLLEDSDFILAKL